MNGLLNIMICDKWAVGMRTISSRANAYCFQLPRRRIINSFIIFIYRTARARVNAFWIHSLNAAIVPVEKFTISVRFRHLSTVWTKRLKCPQLITI